MSEQWFTNAKWGLSGDPVSFQVSEGRVIARRPGTVTEPSAHDLNGTFILPKFHDAHCHILPTGLDLQKLDLSGTTSHAEVLDLLSGWHQAHPEGWLLAVQYDQNRYGGVHLTRAQLDTISSTRPILLRHSNGHASIANSGALESAGVHEETPDPEGGSYERDPDRRLNGLLLETAHEFVTSAAPMPTLEQMVDAILRAADSMAAYGIGAATDMMTGRFDLETELEAYRLAAERGCAIQTRLMLQWRPALGPRGLSAERLQEHAHALSKTGRSGIAGIKIFADGAIGSRTAAIYGQYAPETSGLVHSGPLTGKRVAIQESADGRPVDGQIIYSPQRLNQMVQTAHDQGWQVATHAIGDYAVDLVLDAYEATGDPSRHRIEHAMLLSDAQIERIANAGCYVTMQPEFLLRFGNTYRRQLGPDVAFRLKRLRSIKDAGIRLSLNSDRPIVGGDPWDGIRTACRKPDGFDPSEVLTPVEALTAMTLDATTPEDPLCTLNVGDRWEYQTSERDFRDRCLD